MLDKILESCKYVVDNSKHIIIDYTELDKFIENINFNDLKHWLSKNPYNLFSLGIENIINFLVFFESIDYSFFGEPKWTIDSPLGKKDGSDALLYALLKYVRENNGIVDFSKLDIEEFKSILKGNVEIPLLKERYNTLIEVSNIVKEKMKGNFYEYIKDVKTDEELFDIIITNFPSFKDERKYNGRTICFYKLAQLLVSDILHLRELLEEVDVDYSHLLGCSDYKIPQVLRALDILIYDDELSKMVDNKKELTCSSLYEVEIRASMIVVINYIKNKLDVKSIDVNDYLFVYSKKIKDKMKPYHLCRNTNY